MGPVKHSLRWREDACVDTVKEREKTFLHLKPTKFCEGSFFWPLKEDPETSQHTSQTTSLRIISDTSCAQKLKLENLLFTITSTSTTSCRLPNCLFSTPPTARQP